MHDKNFFQNFVKIFFKIKPHSLSALIVSFAVGFLLNGLNGAAWAVVIMFVSMYIFLPLLVIVLEFYLYITEIPKNIDQEDSLWYLNVITIGEEFIPFLSSIGGLYLGYKYIEIFIEPKYFKLLDVIIGGLSGWIIGCIIGIFFIIVLRFYKNVFK